MLPRSRIPAPRLPAVTFLCGGSPILRTEVANTLADICSSAQAHSFAAPIRDGVCGAFFMGDPAIDVSKLSSLPILPRDDSPTFGDFVSAFSQFMSAFFSDPSILGTLAVRRVEENREWFSHFIFDDADTKENIRMVADLFGRKDALIINFGEPYLTSSSIRVIDLPRSLPLDPISIIEYLAHTLSPQQPRTEAVVITPPLAAKPKDDISDLL